MSVCFRSATVVAVACLAVTACTSEEDTTGAAAPTTSVATQGSAAPSPSPTPTVAEGGVPAPTGPVPTSTGGGASVLDVFGPDTAAPAGTHVLTDGGRVEVGLPDGFEVDAAESDDTSARLEAADGTDQFVLVVSDLTRRAGSDFAGMSFDEVVTAWRERYVDALVAEGDLAVPGAERAVLLYFEDARDEDGPSKDQMTVVADAADDDRIVLISYVAATGNFEPDTARLVAATATLAAGGD